MVGRWLSSATGRAEENTTVTQAVETSVVIAGFATWRDARVGRWVSRLAPGATCRDMESGT